MFHQASTYTTKKFENLYRKSTENENNLVRESLQFKRPTSQSKIKSVLSSLNEQNLKLFRNLPTVKKQVSTPQSRNADTYMQMFQEYQTQDIQLRSKEKRQVYFQQQLAKNREPKVSELSSGSLHLRTKIESEPSKHKSAKDKSDDKTQINNLSGQDFQPRKPQQQLKRSFQEEAGNTYVAQAKSPYYNNVNTRPSSSNHQLQLKKYSHSMQSQSLMKEDSKTQIQAYKRPQTIEESPDIKMRIKTENENSDEKFPVKKRQQFKTDKELNSKVIDPIITQSLPYAPQHIVSRLNSVNLLPQIGKAYFHLDQTKKSSVKNGVLRAYAANTHQGLVRNYNEDRVSIIVNVNSGNRIKNSSYFAVYDGHGGSMCSDFLRDNLHLYVIQDSSFPQNPREAITKGFSIAEAHFISKALEQTKNQHQTERSGSCAVTALLIDDYCYIANVGDSRAVLSIDGGLKTISLTNDHKPQNDNEKTRILMAGGKIYQSQIPADKKGKPAVLGPHRVFPGRLSVTRSFGDIEAKLEQFGGRNGVVIAQPEITQFKIQDNHDFVILASDGIFDKLSNEEVVQLVWESASQIDYSKQNIHDFAAIAIENIMKFSLYKRTLDNITVLLIGFKGLKRHFKSMKQKIDVPLQSKMIRSPNNKLDHHIDIKQRLNLLKA